MKLLRKIIGWPFKAAGVVLLFAGFIFLMVFAAVIGGNRLSKLNDALESMINALETK